MAWPSAVGGIQVTELTRREMLLATLASGLAPKVPVNLTAVPSNSPVVGIDMADPAQESETVTLLVAVKTMHSVLAMRKPVDFKVIA